MMRHMAMRSANKLQGSAARPPAFVPNYTLHKKRILPVQAASTDALLGKQREPLRVPYGASGSHPSVSPTNLQPHPKRAEHASKRVKSSNLSAQAVQRFFMALSMRDISAVLSLMSQEAQLHDLSHDGLISGQVDIARFFLDALTALPDGTQWVVEDCTPDDSYRIAVMWHLEVAGSPVPASNCITFFAFNGDGLITYIRQAPEHWVKSGSWAQGLNSRLTAPLMRTLGPASLWGGVAAVAGTALAHTGLLLAPAPPATTYDPRRQISQPGPQPRSSVAPRDTSSTRNTKGVAVQQQQQQHSSVVRQQSVPLQGTTTADSSVAGDGQSMHPPVAQPVTQDEGQHLRSHSGSIESPVQPSHTHVAAANNIVPAAGVQPEAAMLQQAIELTHVAGLWEKDVAASDSEEYERSLDLWGIQGPQRATARLIEGMEVKAAGKKLSVNFLTVIPMFKVTEEYVEGQAARLMRRDLRSGHAQATLSRAGGAITTQVSWQAPHAGQLQEVYELSECGKELSITSTLSIGQRSETSRALWRRAQHASRDQLLQASEKKHGNYSTILRKFGLPV